MTTTKKRRAYGKGVVGVTTVIQTLAKPQLLFWAANLGAEAAAQAVAGGMAVDAAIEVGRRAHIRKRDEAADVGTLAHSYVERWLEREAVAVDLANEQEVKAHGAATKIIDWVEGAEDRGDLEVVASEIQLVDELSGYGGTPDMVVRLRSGKHVLLDFKTGRNIYDEVAIQLGAYRCLWQLRHRDAPITHALVLHSPVDGPFSTLMLDVDTLEAGATVFAALLHTYRTMPRLKKATERSHAEE